MYTRAALQISSNVIIIRRKKKRIVFLFKIKTRCIFQEKNPEKCEVVRVKPNNDSEIIESKKEKYRGKRERRLMIVELARTYKCACMSQAGECKGAVDWRDGE